MFKQTVSLWRRLVGGKPSELEINAPDGKEDDRRVWVRYPADVETKLQVASERVQKKRSARVRNISLGGINLVVNLHFEPGSMLSVDLPTADKGVPTVLACVIHCGAAKPGEWSLGCNFSREL